ncbi:MAG: hypothetical protein Unbinned5089contig1000_19 [Prokaryotic dsDNA virus sp.]|nr:MAG: hypothetical protein Unbinned5089contig1000_19 [Prokaryotic dsDNA virus sp.]|tara:strand:+ start:1302 stop:1793 length:492 start_codon:yes stop_codon:yes gene_type:complete
MKIYYSLIDNIYNYLIGNNSINTVTFGDLLEVDLSKQTIFPLAHVNVNEVTFDEFKMTFSLNVIVMDIVDEDKDDKQDKAKPHLGLDNKHDILNSMLSVINGLQSSLRRGGMETNDFELNETSTATLFEDRFENLLTGWSMVINIEVPNNDMALINADGSSCL